VNLYNDIDEGVCAWLRELIKDGLIPPGDVSSTSITELNPDDLNKYTQCHFFCGIAGWLEAFRLAGIDPASRRWTGSCPCQPFSAAGSQEGQADARHLWPAFMRLIRICRPDCVYGEQVEGAIGFGWLDGIQADLEAEGYAVGHCVLGAHSAGSPNIRQRLYWVAYAECGATERRGHDMGGTQGNAQEEARQREWVRNDSGAGGDADRGLAHATSARHEGAGATATDDGDWEDTDAFGRLSERESPGGGEPRRLSDALGVGLEECRSADTRGLAEGIREERGVRSGSGG
jgi:DNA (cytosine-5)-methyltransferase 1